MCCTSYLDPDRTAYLVKMWNLYQEAKGDPSIILAIEVELQTRPVKERLAAGYRQ